jgi:hypothetical protein
MELDDTGVPTWFKILEKFEFNFNPYDDPGTLEMRVTDANGKDSTFVVYASAGDNLADLMRAAWMEENPVILKKRLSDGT